jgi:predicted TIM-barrel fold metal-dependent hydrolase
LGEVSKKYAKKIFKIFFPNKVFKTYKDLRNDFSIEHYVYLENTDKLFDDSKKGITNYLDELESNISIAIRESETVIEKSIVDWKFINLLIRIKDVIKILKTKKMSKVLDIFQEDHAISKVANGKQITVVLGMDLNMGWGYGSKNYDIEKSQEFQNNELLQLVKEEPILPFFPVDPRRSNLYDNFLKAFNGSEISFYGVKAYPALGYVPSDPCLDPIFKICSDKNIPVTTHCGGTSVSTFLKDIEVNDGGNIYLVPGKDRVERATYLNEPERWLPVLKKYPKLRLNFGHFGGVTEWEKSDINNSKRITTILQFMQDYDNVYADFSFNIESKTAMNNFEKELKQNIIMQKRSLYGTDYWVILPKTNLIKTQKKFIKKTNPYFYKMSVDNVLSYLNINH